MDVLFLPTIAVRLSMKVGMTNPGSWFQSDATIIGASGAITLPHPAIVSGTGGPTLQPKPNRQRQQISVWLCPQTDGKIFQKASLESYLRVFKGWLVVAIRIRLAWRFIFTKRFAISWIREEFFTFHILPPFFSGFMPWKVSLYDSVDSGCDFLARMPPANWRIQCVDFPCDSLASRDIADAVVFPANFASRTFLLRLFACFWARNGTWHQARLYWRFV